MPYRKSFNFLTTQRVTLKPKVAISACLNGEPVRYDGRDQSLETTSTILAKHLNLISICPELIAGMSVPRPAIQLVKTVDRLEAVGRDDRSINVTTALQQAAEQTLSLHQQHLCAYILKSRSPSCGLGSTAIYNPQGETLTMANGLQAEYFQQYLPWLLLRDERQLQTAVQCEQFIFHCHLLMDIQLSTEQLGLLAVDQHYQPLLPQLVPQISAATLEQLNDLAMTGAEQDYWTMLKLQLDRSSD